MTTAAFKSSSNSWTLRLFTLLIWLLVGLCTAYWAFKFAATKTVEATAALAAPTVVVDSKAIGKLLGATDVVTAKALNTPASTKFALFGLANSVGGQGVALIALDGKPAKPYRVGSLVADNFILKSISKTGVVLATSLKSPDGVTLELPERKPINNPTNNFAGAPPSTNMAAQPPRFPAINPSNANPTGGTNPTGGAPSLPLVTAPMPSPVVQPNGAVPGAAAAISRFAPRVGTVDGTVAAPDTPVSATSSSVGPR
jgi:general secretion pathway protein C